MCPVLITVIQAHTHHPLPTLFKTIYIILLVIIIGYRHNDSSSNPRQGCLHFSHSANTLGKGMHPIILPSVIGK